MTGMKHRETGRPVYKKLNIWTLASQYILSLMTLMINNLGHFTFNYAVYNKSTWHGWNLHDPQSHLAMRQKGVYYMGVKSCNSLPDYWTDLVHDKKQFIGKIKEILTHNPFYSVDEFLLHCQDLQLRK
jgi:hypothetical protein